MKTHAKNVIASEPAGERGNPGVWLRGIAEPVPSQVEGSRTCDSSQ